jgi:hypothetical protein
VWVLLEDVLEAFLYESHCRLGMCEATLRTTMEGIKEAKTERGRAGRGKTECLNFYRTIKPWLLKYLGKLQVRGMRGASASKRGAEKCRQSSLPLHMQRKQHGRSIQRN